MNPRAFLVPSDLDLVLGDQDFRGAIAEGGERGHVCVFLVVVVVVVAYFPDADFVVLVRAEEFVGLDY